MDNERYQRIHDLRVRMDEFDNIDDSLKKSEAEDIFKQCQLYSVDFDTSSSWYNHIESSTGEKRGEYHEQLRENATLGFERDGKFNAVRLIDGKAYRDAIEVLIFDDQGRVFMYVTPSEFDEGEIDYILPGGGKEAHLPDIEQAKVESDEEAGLVITNVQYTGVSEIETWKTQSFKPFKINGEEYNYVGKVKDYYTADVVPDVLPKHDPECEFDVKMRSRGRFYSLHELHGNISKERIKIIEKVLASREDSTVEVKPDTVTLDDGESVREININNISESVADGVVYDVYEGDNKCPHKATAYAGNMHDIDSLENVILLPEVNDKDIPGLYRAIAVMYANSITQDEEFMRFFTNMTPIELRGRISNLDESNKENLLKWMRNINIVAEDSDNNELRGFNKGVINTIRKSSSSFEEAVIPLLISMVNEESYGRGVYNKTSEIMSRVIDYMWELTDSGIIDGHEDMSDDEVIDTFINGSLIHFIITVTNNARVVESIQGAIYNCMYVPIVKNSITRSIVLPEIIRFTKATLMSILLGPLVHVYEILWTPEDTGARALSYKMNDDEVSTMVESTRRCIMDLCHINPLLETSVLLEEIKESSSNAVSSLDAVINSVKELRKTFKDETKKLMDDNKEFIEKSRDFNYRGTSTDSFEYSSYPYWKTINMLLSLEIPSYNPQDAELASTNVKEFRQKYFEPLLTADGLPEYNEKLRGGGKIEITRAKMSPTYTKYLNIVNKFNNNVQTINGQLGKLLREINKAKNKAMVEGVTLDDILSESVNPNLDIYRAMNIINEAEDGSDKPKEDGYDPKGADHAMTWFKECYKVLSAKMLILEEGYTQGIKYFKYVQSLNSQAHDNEKANSGE